MISPDLIPKLSYVAEEDLKGKPVKAVLVLLTGLGYVGIKNSLEGIELEWPKEGILVVHPHHNPWSWTNPQTVQFVDDLLAAIYDKYGLAQDIPTLAFGCSMGGHGALLYTVKSQRRIAGCIAISPVCDLLYHYSERGDLPRTMHSAFGYKHDITAELKDHSPLHQADQLPRVPYWIAHGEQDNAVGKPAHSDRLVEAMRKRSHNVTYMEDAQMAHCGPLTDAMKKSLLEFISGIANPHYINAGY